MSNEHYLSSSKNKAWESTCSKKFMLEFPVLKVQNVFFVYLSLVTYLFSKQVYLTHLS